MEIVQENMVNLFNVTDSLLTTIISLTLVDFITPLFILYDTGIIVKKYILICIKLGSIRKLSKLVGPNILIEESRPGYTTCLMILK